jgi:excisionase family DNA binding protein
MSLRQARKGTTLPTQHKPHAREYRSVEDEKLVMTVVEAGKALDLSRNAAYEAVRRGDIPHIKIGRRLLVPRAALERLLSGEAH